MRNGWDIVDSNLEKTGNEIEFNRKWAMRLSYLLTLAGSRGSFDPKNGNELTGNE